MTEILGLLHLPHLKEKGSDIYDLVADHGYATKAQIEKLIVDYAKPVAELNFLTPQIDDIPAINLHSWDKIHLEEVVHLMADFIPMAELTILEGHGGVGKTSIILDLIARLSKGFPMPDGSP